MINEIIKLEKVFEKYSLKVKNYKIYKEIKIQFNNFIINYIFETSKYNKEEFDNLTKKSITEIHKKFLLDEKKLKEEFNNKDFINYEDFSITEKNYLNEVLQLSFKTKSFKDIVELKKNIKRTINKESEIIKLNRKISEAKNILNLEKYEKSFNISFKRKFKLILGPTNSGKTYKAMEILKKSANGIYLAPLRLLALENYEYLNNENILCDLITGEEKIKNKNSTHVSSTIEMLDFNKTYETAVIDEIHLLNDKNRGATFTSAIIGVKAKEVIILGTLNMKESLIKLLKYLKEDYEIIETKRHSNLNIGGIFNFNEIQNGDVFIAFSRKNVLKLSENLKSKGHNVSLIYGSLSPEVRKEQSRLFNNGENNILVSTDAIGMGLNLPCTRIIFTEIEKYDGEVFRPLEHNEVLQIAGRAGRYTNDGYIYALNNFDVKFLKQHLEQNELIEESKFKIKPNLWHIKELSEILETFNIHKIISFFMTNINIKHDLFVNNIDESILELSLLIEEECPEFSLEEKFKLCYSPVSTNKEEIHYFIKCISKIKRKENFKFNLNLNFNEDLEFLENLSKNITIYSWFANNYSTLFITEQEELMEYRSKISEKILEILKNLGNNEDFYEIPERRKKFMKNFN